MEVCLEVRSVVSALMRGTRGESFECEINIGDQYYSVIQVKGDDGTSTLVVDVPYTARPALLYALYTRIEGPVVKIEVSHPQGDDSDPLDAFRLYEVLTKVAAEKKIHAEWNMWMEQVPIPDLGRKMLQWLRSALDDDSFKPDGIRRLENGSILIETDALYTLHGVPYGQHSHYWALTQSDDLLLSYHFPPERENGTLDHAVVYRLISKLHEVIFVRWFGDFIRQNFDLFITLERCSHINVTDTVGLMIDRPRKGEILSIKLTYERKDLAFIDVMEYKSIEFRSVAAYALVMPLYVERLIEVMEAIKHSIEKAAVSELRNKSNVVLLGKVKKLAIELAGRLGGISFTTNHLDEYGYRIKYQGANDRERIAIITLDEGDDHPKSIASAKISVYRRGEVDVEIFDFNMLNVLDKFLYRLKGI